MFAVSPKKLDKVHDALVDAGYEFDPDDFTVEKLLAAVNGTKSYGMVSDFFISHKAMRIEMLFNQISLLIYKTQTTPGIELEEFQILNKISEHAIVALRENDRDWLMRIRQVIMNGLKQFKIQITKRKENDFRGTV